MCLVLVFYVGCVVGWMSWWLAYFEFICLVELKGWNGVL